MRIIFLIFIIKTHAAQISICTFTPNTYKPEDNKREDWMGGRYFNFKRNMQEHAKYISGSTFRFYKISNESL